MSASDPLNQPPSFCSNTRSGPVENAPLLQVLSCGAEQTLHRDGSAPKSAPGGIGSPHIYKLIKPYE